MPEQPGIRQNGFFQKVIASANSGLAAEPVKTGILNSQQHFPEPSHQMDLDHNALMHIDPPQAHGDVTASGINDNQPSAETDGLTDTSWCGEEGPLSGAAPGLNERVGHFGVSAFSRSDPKAVGSASESSRDTHVKGIEHTEVGHASGHLVSSLTGRIESGVSKTPESNQVLSNGSKVVRYADAKDWRQQAVSSNGHGERGLGQSGQDDDRAGLPPPSPLQDDRTAGMPVDEIDANAGALETDLGENPPADTPAHTATAAALHREISKGNAINAIMPGQDDMPNDVPNPMTAPKLSAPNTLLDAFVEENTPETDAPEHKGHKAHESHPSNSMHPGHTRMAKSYTREFTAGEKPPSTSGAVTPSPPARANAKSGVKTGPASSPGPVSMTEPAGQKPPAPHDDSMATPQKRQEPVKTAKTLIHPDKPVSDLDLFLSAGQRENRFSDQGRNPVSTQPAEPRVEIGHIDVIVETPQAPANTGRETSQNAIGMTSRYYLKGL